MLSGGCQNSLEEKRRLAEGKSWNKMRLWENLLPQDQALRNCPVPEAPKDPAASGSPNEKPRH